MVGKHCGFAVGRSAGVLEGSRISVSVRALRPHLDAALSDRRRGNMGDHPVDCARGGVGSPIRRGQWGSVLRNPREDPGALVLRLCGVSEDGGRRHRAADSFPWNRRVVAKKKHRQFVAVIIDHTNHRVLEVLESREKARVKEYLEAGRTGGQFASLEEVTTDMWDGYVEAVKETFAGKVRVTVDRFHVMQNFQERLTDARREIQRGLSKEEAKALKGSRWLWQTNDENLTSEERRELERLCRQFPRLGDLRQQREALRQIFEDHRLQTAEGGARRLRDWIVHARQLGLDALNAFCQTLENWLDKIVNYFINRSTNGPTEGFNHGLRAILWRAFGMTNFQHFRARVLHTFGSPKPQ